MRRVMTLLITLGVTVLAVASTASADTWGCGYFRSDGTYVQGHWRSAADGNFWNNWSTWGNYNPYTGG